MVLLLINLFLIYFIICSINYYISRSKIELFFLLVLRIWLLNFFLLIIIFRFITINIIINLRIQGLFFLDYKIIFLKILIKFIVFLIILNRFLFIHLKLFYIKEILFLIQTLFFLRTINFTLFPILRGNIN
jgi:hypothetical protein